MNRIFPFVLIAASACVAEVEGSDLLTEVLPPEDIGLLWDDSFNGIEDDVVAIVPVDVLPIATTGKVFRTSPSRPS